MSQQQNMHKYDSLAGITTAAKHALSACPHSKDPLKYIPVRQQRYAAIANDAIWVAVAMLQFKLPQQLCHAGHVCLHVVSLAIAAKMLWNPFSVPDLYPCVVHRWPQMHLASRPTTVMPLIPSPPQLLLLPRNMLQTTVPALVAELLQLLPHWSPHTAYQPLLLVGAGLGLSCLNSKPTMGITPAAAATAAAACPALAALGASLLLLLRC